MQRNIFITFFISIFIFIGWYAIHKNREAVGFNGSAVIGTSVGNIAPDFTITTIDGETITGSSLRDKVVVITSSAAWCPTCAMEARQFASVYQKYQGAPVVFITVDIDPRDGKDFIRQFKTDNNTPWYYTDARGGMEITQKYDLDRFEITYLIDTEGIIRFMDRRITTSDTLDQAIQKSL